MTIAVLILAIFGQEMAVLPNQWRENCGQNAHSISMRKIRAFMPQIRCNACMHLCVVIPGSTKNGKNSTKVVPRYPKANGLSVETLLMCVKIEHKT